MSTTLSAHHDAAGRVVVEESNLAVQIAAIRRARTRRAASIDRNAARRGYRFVGPVTEVQTRRNAAAGAEPLR
jgi:DNA-binding winged helix-turn-helix (wHTH) protein